MPDRAGRVRVPGQTPGPGTPRETILGSLALCDHHCRHTHREKHRQQVSAEDQGRPQADPGLSPGCLWLQR